MLYYNFTDNDFSSCNPPCKLGDLSPRLLEGLQYARSLCSFPFKITSAYRSRSYELEKGRSGNSAHCLGLAVDIACTDVNKRYILVQNLLRAGFFRIGIAKTYIHADCDYSKKSAIWLYE